jgi:hypothetical protein
MNKLFRPSDAISKTTMFLTLSTSIYLYSPQVSAQNYRNYRNCAELQQRFIENNPGIMYQGFEKSKMRIKHSMPFQSVYATSFICSGGTYMRRFEDGIKRSCTGYIVHYVSPYSNDQGRNDTYFAGRGEYEDRRIDGRMERYCRPVG